MHLVQLATINANNQHLHKLLVLNHLQRKQHPSTFTLQWMKWVLAAGPHRLCHLENKWSVKYSIAWDQGQWQQLSSYFISSKLSGIKAISVL